MSTAEPIYSSGETILSGDHITFEGESGLVEYVITPDHPQWDSYWKDLGTGVMLSVPSFGSVYVPFDDNGLLFISRG
ncbi:MAG: hypothetical protein ABFS19_01240 [Thermodesulfobacteriota bacterium]